PRPPPRPTLFPYTTLFRSLPSTSVFGPRELSAQPSSSRQFESRSWARTPKQCSRELRTTTRANVQSWACPLDGRYLQVGPPDRSDRKSTRLNSSHLVISYA